AMNYIKRLIGLPGETIAICGGNLYFLRPDRSPQYDDSQTPEKERWHSKFMHADDERALELFRKGGFEIIRKPPEVLLAMMRLVYDNDRQADDLTAREWQRWYGDGEAWEALDGGKAFRHGARADTSSFAYLHYRHRLRDQGGKDSLITDFMGYNSGESLEGDPGQNRWQGRKSAGRHGVNWVGDLILECEVKVEKAEGELVLELGRGHDRFKATWDLSSGSGLCTLTRKRDGKEEKLDSKPTKLRKGTYR